MHGRNTYTRQKNKKTPRRNIEQPHKNNNEYDEYACGDVRFADDTTIKTQGASKIYPELVAFKEATKNTDYPSTGKSCDTCEET